MIALRRIAANRAVLSRTPQRAARMYSSDTDGPQSTGTQEGFNKREKASEDWYIRQHEKESLDKLRAEIQRREKELGDLKDKASELSKQ